MVSDHATEGSLGQVRHELSNAALARRPLALWPEAERLALFEPAAS